MTSVKWLRFMVMQFIMIGALLGLSEVARADWTGPTNPYHPADYNGNGYIYERSRARNMELEYYR
jgi:hypothetical protein